MKVIEAANKPKVGTVETVDSKVETRDWKLTAGGSR